MNRVIWLAIACACGGGGGDKRPVAPRAGSAVIWETPREPWHVPHPGRVAMVVGDRATFGGPYGWVVELDLATGAVGRSRKLPMGLVTSLVDLGGGRRLVVGFATTQIDAPPAAFVLDPAFEAKQVVLPVRNPTKARMTWPRAVRVADGIVISGGGLPLSVYDPKDLSVRATIDNEIGWSGLGARGDILLAERDHRIKRFDLSTNGQRDLGYGVSTHWVVADALDLIRVARDRKWIVELHRDDKTTVALPDDTNALHPYDAQHFITTKDHELRIHELPSGTITKRITVGDDVRLGGLAISGKRAIVNAGGGVRVIDLDTGAIHPRQQTRQAAWLAVGDDGLVLGGDEASVWTMTGGKVLATEPATDLETLRPDDPRHYVTATHTDATSTLVVHTVGDPAVRSTVVRKTALAELHLGRDGTLVTVTEYDDRKELASVKAGRSSTLFAFNQGAEAIAVEPGHDFLIAVDGRVAVTRQDGTPISTLRIPHCDTIYQHGQIDPDSTRAVTYDDKDLALWDRKTGTLVTSIKLGEPDDLRFIPKRAELVITFDDRVVLWSPTKGTRTLPWPGVLEPAVSPDGKKLALSFHDGRVGLYDLDALLAAPLQPDFPAGDAVPETCGEDDPLRVDEPDPDQSDNYPDSDHDDGGGGGDGDDE